MHRHLISFCPNLVICATAALLLTTALLKTLYPAEATSVALAYGVSYSAIILVVQLELLVAAWLVSGWRPKFATRSAAVLFSTFAGFSLIIALAGRETCGCFGSVPVSPWITFSLDMLLVGVLLTLPVGKLTGLLITSPRVLCTLAIYLLLAAFSLGYMLTHRPLAGGDDSIIDTSTGLVILEPDQWVGESFPLQSFITPEVDFSAGETWVLLYHHDCPACRRKLDEYQSRAQGTPGARLVVVEVPPFGPARRGSENTIPARLAGDIEWFIQTPTEIQLVDGVVRDVRQQEK